MTLLSPNYAILKEDRCKWFRNVASKGIAPHLFVNGSYSFLDNANLMSIKGEHKEKGVETFDVATSEMFRLKAAVHTTISDFPGYANLSGWSTKGEYASAAGSTAEAASGSASVGQPSQQGILKGFGFHEKMGSKTNGSYVPLSLHSCHGNIEFANVKEGGKQ
ncbi:reverse transcriptase domain-containing protein [Tanacetum coccineum]